MKGGFLTLVLIVMVLPTVVSAAVIGRPANNLGLVAYWPLDEGRGTQAADVSGNKKHGVISGSPPWVAGQRGRAIQFGTSLNQYIDSGTIAALNNATRATTCAYIRKAAAGDQVSFGADNVTAFQGFGLEWSSDGNV